MKTIISSIILVCLLASALAVPTKIKKYGFFMGYESRIVNGTDVPPGKYPEMVSLKLTGSGHNCGGTILNEYWVLSAGHCVYGYNPSSYLIYSGSVNLTGGGIVRQVTEIIWHENFTYIDTENDIAVLKVDTPFVWDDNHAPVLLPAQSQQTPGDSNATLVGWGTPYSGGSVMNQLQEVDYWTVTDEQCDAAHSGTTYESNICAYYPGGGKGQCNGDSGGPLFVNGQQVGVVSWSAKPCTVAPYPGVLTEVAYYIDWISSKIN